MDSELNVGIVFSGGFAKGAYEIGFCKAILEYINKENIKLAQINGLGGANEFTIGVRNPETKTYDPTEYKGRYDVVTAYDIANAPTIEPERKRGKWEIYIISMLDGEGCKCSECGFEGAPYWDYCPNCGSYNGGGTRCD